MKKAHFLRQTILAVITLLMAFWLSTRVGAREITDMYGRKFVISDYPRKVFSASPPVTWLLYTIDPTMLTGLNFPIKENDRKYLYRCASDLPVIGGWFGQAYTPNLEMLLKIKPEVVAVSINHSALSAKICSTMKTMGMPVLNVPVYALADYPNAYATVGRILGREARSRKLGRYCSKTLHEAAMVTAGIPDKRRVSVYYAEGADGLSTECDSSWHSELITLAGGKNVHQCRAGDNYGMEKVSMEQVLLYNPDVILAFDRTFYRRVFHDAKWRRIRAVRNRKVFFIPDQPTNWFDRPPSFMRFIGLKWVLNLLYPRDYKIDIVKEASDFYRFFLGVEVSEGDMRRIITGE
ncbi:MAG: ABC transporter substrate-binding protein [Geobacteraceae bacterium]